MTNIAGARVVQASRLVAGARFRVARENAAAGLVLEPRDRDHLLVMWEEGSDGHSIIRCDEVAVYQQPTRFSRDHAERERIYYSYSHEQPR